MAVLYNERRVAGVETHGLQRTAVFLSQIDEIVTPAYYNPARLSALHAARPKRITIGALIPVTLLAW